EKRFWLHLGENYIRLGKFKEAITPFEKLAELDATDPAVWERLVELYKNNGMSDKAKRASSKLAELSKS
ncbi:MAG: tetratricopeptide repeat protein, partial [Candidatus Zixiibacteriota bacterium]